MSVKKGILLLLLLYSILHLGYSVLQYNPIWYANASGDFLSIYQGIVDWRNSGDFSLTGWQRAYGYHPSLYILFLMPFTHLPPQVVASFFYFLQFLLFPLAIFWMAKVASRSSAVSATAFLIAAVLSVNFMPFLDTLAKHKVEGIEFFLISMAVLAFRKRRDFWAGVLLALAMNMKYLPAILVAYFLLKREFRVVVGALAAQLLICLVLVAALGWNTFWVYSVEYLFRAFFDPATGYNWSATGSFLDWQTLSGMVNRILSPPVPPEQFVFSRLVSGMAPLAHPALAYGIVTSLKILLGGIYLFVIRRRWSPAQREEKWPFYLLEISLTLLLIVVLEDTTRLQYAILLLPAFVWVGLLLIRHGDLFHWKEKVLFVAAYGLSAMVIPGGLLNRLLPPHPVWGREYSMTYLWFSLPFHGFLLLFLCVLLCYHRLMKWKKSASTEPLGI